MDIIDRFIGVIGKAERKFSQKRTQPIIVEFLIQIVISLVLTIFFSIIVILCFAIYYCFAKSIDREFLKLSLLMTLMLPWLGLLVHHIRFLVFFAVILDKLLGNRVKTKKVTITVVEMFVMSLNYISKSSDLDWVFSGGPCHCKWYFWDLADERKPKLIKVRKPPHFYSYENHPRGREREYVRFVMTIKKSKLIDRLYRLEPTMEFEVSYLRFSKLLKEIRPIEGYEYAEGVPEILKQINSMYP